MPVLCTAPIPGSVHDAPHPPAVIVLITHSPYSTGHAYGGIALAVACAHQGIRTQVIFLEDGIIP